MLNEEFDFNSAVLLIALQSSIQFQTHMLISQYHVKLTIDLRYPNNISDKIYRHLIQC